jgi:hypothetical protein
MPDRGARRLKWVPLVGAVALLLAACGGEESVERPDFSDEDPPALWNPCDALSVDFVAEHFGADTEKFAGTAAEPDCRFVPVEESDPGLTASYLLFPAGLEASFATMEIAEDADVRSPAIEGADDARIVVNAGEDHLAVTGFVQNGDLIQNVDVIAPAPYDERRMVAGVQTTLTTLSAHAVAADVD